MPASRNELFEKIARGLGFDLTDEIRVGGNYTPAVLHAGTAYVSGQVPRIGTVVVVTGRVGAATSLEQACHAARICTVRALAILRGSLSAVGGVGGVDGLDSIAHALRMTVYVQSAEDFTQQSEVADAASALLHQVLGSAGTHTRTSVGVVQLPKNASVEIDLVVAID